MSKEQHNTSSEETSEGLPVTGMKQPQSSDGVATDAQPISESDGSLEPSQSPDSVVNELKAELEKTQQRVAELELIENEYNKITQCDSSPKIVEWWHDFSKHSRKATKEDLLLVRMYPCSVIELLIEINDKSEAWYKDVFGLRKKADELKYMLFKTEDELRQSGQKEFTLRQEKSVLTQKIKELDSKCKELESSSEIFKSERNSLLRELAQFNTGGGTTPQHEKLHPIFKDLREQSFKDISNRVFSFFSEECPNYNKSVNRKEKVCKIRHKLAEKIFMSEETVNNQDAIRSLFLSALKNHGCYRVSNEEKFEEILSDVNLIAEKSLKLKSDMSCATQPGVLLWYEQKKPFDPELHEALPGCIEEGEIKFTIFPGYAIEQGNNKRIFEKALVFTDLEQ